MPFKSKRKPGCGRKRLSTLTYTSEHKSIRRVGRQGSQKNDPEPENVPLQGDVEHHMYTLNDFDSINDEIPVLEDVSCEETTRITIEKATQTDIYTTTDSTTQTEIHTSDTCVRQGSVDKITNAAEGLLLLMDGNTHLGGSSKTSSLIRTASHKTNSDCALSVTTETNRTPKTALTYTKSGTFTVTPQEPMPSSGADTGTPKDCDKVRTRCARKLDMDTTTEASPLTNTFESTSAPSSSLTQVNRPVPTVPKWTYEGMKSLPPKEFRRICGVSQGNFEALYAFLGGDEVCSYLKYNYRPSTPKIIRSRLHPKDKLFMTLTRLRRGFSVGDIALLFGLSQSNASSICYVWVQFMYLQFNSIRTEMCVSRFQQPKSKIARCFRKFKNFRMVLDTTEVRIQAPYHYGQQGNTYSEYKAGNVINYLIGISGWGSISFVSPGFEGSISDRNLLQRSGLMDHLDPGDLLLVDRGFSVQDIMDPLQVKIVHPPFLGDRNRLPPEEELLTKQIAASRSHVERAIRKIKCFRILKNITNTMLPILDQIVFVCACLVNFDPNIISM